METLAHSSQGFSSRRPSRIYPLLASALFAAGLASSSAAGSASGGPDDGPSCHATAPAKQGPAGSSVSQGAPHMDHEPRHGGIFFMAPNQIHHLEGVLVPPGALKIYFYDAWTRPIPAAGFEAYVTLDGDPEGRKIPLALRPRDGTLFARLPRNLPDPTDLTVYITFPPHQGGPAQTELFSFSFSNPYR